MTDAQFDKWERLFEAHKRANRKYQKATGPERMKLLAAAIRASERLTKYEIGHNTFKSAMATAKSVSERNSDGEPWLNWAIWGNHPETEVWCVLAQS
jgi:hypothetical protein